MEDPPRDIRLILPEEDLTGDAQHNRRRWPVVVAAVAAVAVTAFLGWRAVDSHEESHRAITTLSSETPSATPSLPEQSQADQFILQAGATLLAQHQESHGGWRWQSKIQSPNFQE